MSKISILLETKVNYEYFAEISPPRDPIQQIFHSSKSLMEIETKLAAFKLSLQKRYPNHSDFYYKFEYTSPSNGCYEAWFDLYGDKQ